MESSEPCLEPPDQGREGARAPAVQLGANLREVAQLTDPYPESVEPGGRGSPSRPPVGETNPIMSQLLFLVQGAREPVGRSSARGELEALPEPLEEERVALGPQEHPEQFATRARVVPELRAQPGDLLRLGSRRARERPTLDEVDHHVPVPDATDESGEAFESAVEREDELPVPAREQPLPDRESVAQSPHLPVELVQALGGRVRASDHFVDRPRDLGEESVDLPGERGRAAGDVRAGPAHPSSPPVRHAPGDK